MQWRSLSWLSNYEISEKGDLRRTTPMQTRKSMIYPKGQISNGYRKYKLMLDDGTKATIPAHQLVCEAWYGSRPNGHQVAHWDGNKLNNHFSNLRWALPRENTRDNKHQGTWPQGEKNGRAKVTDAIVKEIRAKYTGARGQVPRLCDEYGLRRSAMREICNGRHWGHVSQ